MIWLDPSIGTTTLLIDSMLSLEHSGQTDNATRRKGLLYPRFQDESSNGFRGGKGIHTLSAQPLPPTKPPLRSGAVAVAAMAACPRRRSPTTGKLLAP